MRLSSVFFVLALVAFTSCGKKDKGTKPASLSAPAAQTNPQNEQPQVTPEQPAPQQPAQPVPQQPNQGKGQGKVPVTPEQPQVPQQPVVPQQPGKGQGQVPVTPEQPQVPQQPALPQQPGKGQGQVPVTPEQPQVPQQPVAPQQPGKDQGKGQGQYQGKGQGQGQGQGGVYNGSNDNASPNGVVGAETYADGMSCIDVQARVRSSGATILHHGDLYDRVVTSQAYCEHEETLEPYWLSTADNGECFAGYVCRTIEGN